MKTIVRRLITTAFVVAFVLLTALLAGIVRSSRASLVCGELDVKFTDTLDFVSEDDVRSCLERNYGSYIGQKLDSVKLGKIESAMEEQSAIKNCEAWTTDDGKLHLLIERRHPRIRFINGNDEAYADKEGNVIRLKDGFVIDVPVIQGPIPEDSTWVSQMLEMMDYMDKHYWNTRIGAMKVDSKGELVLTSAEGGEKILFGAPVDVEEKFWRLGKYYSHIVPSKDDGYYKTINVKFKKQIICSRTGI